MQNLVDFILKFISDFSPEKGIVVVLIVIVLAVFGISYEIQTSQIEIEKISRVTNLLKELDPLARSETVEVKSLAIELISRTKQLLNTHTADATALPFKNHRLFLAMILAVPWLLLSLVGVVEAFQREPDWSYGLFGCLFIGTALAFVGYAIPVDIHWFYRYLTIPLALTGGLALLFYLIGSLGEERRDTIKR